MFLKLLKMVSCGKCSDDVTFGALCSKCKLDYHYQCSGVTEKGYLKLSERSKAAWVCVTCKNEASSSTSAASAAVKSASASSKEPSTLTLANVMEEFNKLNSKLSPLLSLVDEIRGIKSDISDLKRSSSTVPTQFKAMDERLSKVERRLDEAEALKVQVAKLERSLNDKEQWLRSNNAEIKGVPQKHGENLLDIVAKIGSKISYPISKCNINYVARVPSRDSEQAKPIIVAFTNRYMKEDFVAAARSLKYLVPTDIDLQGSSKIYINDHLTVQNKQLLTKAKAAAQQFEFQYVWVKHAKILVRKNSTSNIIKIRTENDLHKIM